MISLDALSFALPPGRIVHAEEEGDGRPAFWRSDGPVPPGSWASMRAGHPRSGLWPLLLTPLGDVEVSARGATARSTPVTCPRRGRTTSRPCWPGGGRTCGRTGEPGTDMTAPYGARWPGRSPAPGATADELAGVLASFDENTRLGLFAAERGADAITSAGRRGPVNHVPGTAKLSAVLRDREDRFGARLVGAGFATLQVSVAAPPANREEALPVAAEHFAFCPDNVWQGAEGTLAGEDTWHFWWD